MTADLGDTQNNKAEQSPGELLKTAREQAGLSTRQVAEALKLLPDQIDSIERDEFERFNGPLFCKAHLKAYAKLLAVDTAAVLEAYQATTQDTLQALDKPLVVTPIQRPNRGYSFKYWGAAAALVLSVTLWIQHNQQTEQELNTTALQPDASVEVDGNDQSSLLGLGSATIESESADFMAEKDYLTEIDAEQTLTLDTVEQSSVVIDLPARKVAASTSVSQDQQAPTDSGADELHFSFSEDCWVEVTDGNGDIIFASLKQADETLQLTGLGPFKVLLGYAHGVSLDYNGEPIEINVKNRNNSARFVVGNLPVQ